MKRITRFSIIGTAVGFGLAAEMVFSSIAGLDRVPGVRSLLQFFSSVPVYLTWAVNASQAFVWVFIFSYWMLIGTVFALILNLKMPSRFITIFLFTALLITAHWVMKFKFESDFFESKLDQAFERMIMVINRGTSS